MEPSQTQSPPPPSPTVSNQFVEYLATEGVTHAFGVPGGAVMNLLYVMRNDGRLTYVVCRQETGAAYMADGYSRMSGVVGVVVVTSGPGASNAVTGAMNAHAAGSSVLVLSGEVAEAYFGRGYLQEGIDCDLDIDDVYKNAVGFSAVADSPDNFSTLFEAALRTCMGVPRKASHISLPLDVSMASPKNPAVPQSPSAYRAKSCAGSPKEVAALLRDLSASKMPLLYIGSGCRSAIADRGRLDRLMTFAENWAVPIVTSPEAKGIFPETHPMSLMSFGIAGSLWPNLYLTYANPTEPSLKYDFLAVLGSQLGEFATQKWNQELEPLTGSHPVYQVDLNPYVIGRDYPLKMGIVADTGAVLDQVCAADPPDDIAGTIQARREVIAGIRATSPFFNPATRESTLTPILPQALMKIVNESIPLDSALFVDAGNCVGWCVHELIIDPPMELYSCLSMGPMGWAVCAVIGARIAQPGRPCIAVCGDGAFLMHGAEVSTAARYGVGAIWIVLNDNDLHMVSQGMANFYPGDNWTDYYQLGGPDLVGFAKSLGADAYRAASPDDVRAMLPKVLGGANLNKPQVLVVDIDQEQIPPYYVKYPT